MLTALKSTGESLAFDCIYPPQEICRVKIQNAQTAIHVLTTKKAGFRADLACIDIGLSFLIM